jgi:formylglycine-generating enzyme required for sulfatase activity
MLHHQNRLRYVIAAAASLTLLTGLPIAAGAAPAAFRFAPAANIIPAPSDPAQWPAFRAALAQWRAETKASLNYSDALYRRNEFAWSAANYSCCFLMTCDETFYDRRTGRYTVDAFLDHGRREFGGYDSVVLWHAYPRIGVDQRNQFDFYRDLPGGLDGLRAAVLQFQRRGVKVYIDYNPWDVGTRREQKSDVDALVDMVRALDVDGIFLDTMNNGAAEFRAKLDAARLGVILEGEGVPPLERIADHHASWAQGFDDSPVPGVLRHKWLERRHIQHAIRRWDFDHSGELHSAWMNGSGMMVWENVFGAWVAWNARDRSLLRAMLPIQRRYNKLFCGEGWTPLVPTEKTNVYASLWSDGAVRLWTLVNRGTTPVNGTLLAAGAAASQRYFDLIAGRELKPATQGDCPDFRDHAPHGARENGTVPFTPSLARKVALEATIPARGIGCFLAAPGDKLAGDFLEFLAAQKATNVRADFDAAHPRRETRLRPVAPTRRPQSIPLGMVAVRPRASEVLTIYMRARECGFYDSNTDSKDGFWASYQFPARGFQRRVALRPFAIDETPVTNAQFAGFLKATDYHPRHPENFLKDWRGGKPPAGREDHPVVWVDLDDARAYAAWAGKRLPSEEEWQYAAQGGDGREYPWGSGLRAGVCNPGPSATTPVKAFPAGRSPCGCYDMCGNVWQWTESERSDGRTRFCIIRGGSYFTAKGSGWYVDGGPRPANFATKFLMIWPGLDRCGTIGFRCVVDLP